ncbi:tRNA 2-thiouridine(34) synthase MnmA [Candidatus Pacearchaeota archaeon]|nr:tRNA 2-thiouridine(34) synthase MnmA [Candidatus Pacearchaeota archaeon]
MKKEKKKVVVGISGGVDSSVAALLLKRQGYEVIGVFLKNYSETKNKLGGECNWIEERRIAQKIAAMLKIPLVTVDYEKEYRKLVIDKMFNDYKKGLTPNPDVLCNKVNKFPGLLRVAKGFGADWIATGHYARIKNGKKGFELLAGKDRTKDQSYFLHQLGQGTLSKVIFPLGEYKKERIRKIAKNKGFPNWNKKGTSGICFVGKVDMKKFLKKKIKEKQGKVFSPEGEVIGKHSGTMFFTIGERAGEKKGFRVDEEYRKKFSGKKLYVAEKRKGNVLVIAPEGNSALQAKEVFIKDFHLINPREKIPGKGLKARIRHLGKLNSGKLRREKGRWSFNFDRGIFGIAEGQFIVIYKGDKVIGGGEIRRKYNREHK